VEIITVEQVRSEFLDQQYRNETSLKGEWSTRADALSYIETLFDEQDDTGITAAISDFTDSLQEMSKDPVNKEYRTNLLQNGLKMTETFQHYVSQLTDKQTEQNSQVEVLVGQISDLAASVSDLNQQIARYELSGQKANDLRDQRNQMLDQLSGLAEISYTYNSQDQLTVNLGGQALVENDTVHKLALAKTIDNPVTGQADSLYEVQWEETGNAAAITGGNLKAYLDLRDGSSAETIGIPWLVGQLDTLANSMATEFNKIHQQGWTLPVNGASATGVLFFKQSTDIDGNLLAVRAADFTVDDAIKNDVYQIAASSAQVDAANINNGNKENIQSLIDLFNQTDLDTIGSFNSYLKSFVGSIAVETSHTNKMLSSETVLTDSIDQQRQALSGVSLDEEMTNLIKWQHSYSAAARIITTVDEYLDVLINKTGIVGR